MKTDVIVNDDSRIKIITYLLALTDYPKNEQKKRPHRIHKLLNDSIYTLKMFKEHEAVKFIADNINQIPAYFLYAYALSLTYPDFEASSFPYYLYDYCPELVSSNFNRLLKSFYQETTIKDLWKQQEDEWRLICEDASKCFEGIYYKDILEKFFGEVKYDLLFYPNVLVPQLMSSGASSLTQLACIARMPGPVDEDMEVMKFSDDVNWVNIVSFHEFCHPLLDDVFRNNREEVQKSKNIAKNITVFSEYQKHYPEWEDLFAELLIYGMTIVFLRHMISDSAADEFSLFSEQKTGIKLFAKTAAILEEYLIENENGNYITINQYFSKLVEKLI